MCDSFGGWLKNMLSVELAGWRSGAQQPDDFRKDSSVLTDTNHSNENKNSS